MVIDFGNGIRATTTIPDEDAPFGITDHEGAAYPELEISAIEAGVLDGGTVGGTRATMRVIRFEFVHEKVKTTAEIKRLFSPGVQRTASSELGSMPYYVKAVSFPKSDLRAKTKFAILIISEWAYPKGGSALLNTATPPSGGLSYPYSYPYSYGLLASDTTCRERTSPHQPK
jgi:hypothetical protein